MGMPGPQKINRYGVAFKLKAVQMSNQPGVLIKDVAESLCIHPFVLEVAQAGATANWLASPHRSNQQPLPSCSACVRSNGSSSDCRWSMTS